MNATQPGFEVGILPWIKLSEPITVLGIRLVPYEHDRPLLEIDSDRLPELRRIAETFRQIDGQPIPALTLAFPVGGEHLGPFQESDCSRFARVRTIIAIASIANREFFSQSHEYVCAAHFNAYGQRFQAGAEYVVLTPRRRDAKMLATWPTEQIRITCPPQIGSIALSTTFPPNPAVRAAIDRGFLDLLERIVSKDDELAQRVVASVDLYLLGNTDDEVIREREDVVLMEQAMEHLIGKSKARSFAPEVERIIGATGLPAYELSARWKHRDPSVPYQIDGKAPPALSLLGLWAFEFYQLRNALVHGSSVIARSWCWGFKEHAILASWIYPQLLRRYCGELLGLPLSDADEEWLEIAIRRFDLCPLDVRSDRDTPKWSEVESTVAIEMIGKRWLRKFERQPREIGGGGASTSP